MNRINGDATQEILLRLVNANRSDLGGYYQQVLRETLFINRAELRPNILKNIASDEVEAILNFLKQSGFSGTEHGLQLHRIGLSERVVLRLGHVTRLFFLAHLENDQITPMLETVHAYQEAVIQGFVQGLEKYHLGELERTRYALQHGDS